MTSNRSGRYTEKQIEEMSKSVRDSALSFLAEMSSRNRESAQLGIPKADIAGISAILGGLTRKDLESYHDKQASEVVSNITSEREKASVFEGLTINLNRVYASIWETLFPQALAFSGSNRLRSRVSEQGDVFNDAADEAVADSQRVKLDYSSNKPSEDEIESIIQDIKWLIGPPFIAAPTSPDDPGAWQVEVRRRPGTEVSERPDFDITVDGEVPQDAELSWLQPADGPDYAVYAANGPAPVSVELIEREDGTIVIDFHTS